MEAKVDQTPATNSNPVLSIDKNGCIVYSNEAGNLLLNEWDVEIGDKLPSSIIDLVQKVITQNNPEKMEVKVGIRVYLIVFHPLPEQGCVNISGFDISDQKKAEEETKESEERLIALMDHSPSLLFMKDECGRYVYLNNAYEKQFVHSKDWYGKTDFDFWSKESAELFRKNDSLVLKSGKIHQFMEDSTDLNGTRYCWLNYKFPFTDSKNKKYIGGIGIDATDRVRAEEALQESEERYRMLFISMTEGFGLAEVIYNSEGKPIDYRYLEVNPAFELYFGVKREQLLGKTMRETFPKLSPLAIEKYNEVALSGQPINFEIFSHVANKYLDIHAFIPEKGKVALILRDISGRKEVEAKLKHTLDNLDKLVKERTLELQKAYDSLKKSERNLAEAQEMAHIGSWEWDFVNNEFHSSDETYRIFGLKPQESKINYNSALNLVHPDDRDNMVNAVNEALKGNLSDISYRTTRANGEEHVVYGKAEVVFDEKNNPIRLRGTVQDITEHRIAEEKIQNLANIVESSTETIITESFEGIITSWNKGAEQVYGYSAEEIIGKSISILEPPTLTGETHRLCEIIERGEKIQQYETLRLRNDGKLINVSLSIFSVFDNHGRITAASIIATDITRRKEAEERLRESEDKYRNIVETANELILTTDNENVITYVNKKMLDMLGYTIEESIGKPVWNFISEEYKPIVKMNLENRRQGISGSYELKLIRKDGSPIWTFLNAKPLFDQKGKYVGAMSMLTDITKRKQAEEVMANLETARKKEIHHRIKNNLQVISSLLDLQAEQFKNRECIGNSEVLEAFRESQDRVISMALIHEELYRGEELDKLNFSPYIEELATTLFQTYRLGNTEISLSMDLEENIFFDMDIAVPLGIITNELVSNSLKHAFIGRDRGEIKTKLHREGPIELENKGCQSTSTSFTLTISDNGVGIPENLEIEDLDSLGMQLVFSLVDQLDGELELKRDNGTEFTIRFTVTEKNE